MIARYAFDLVFFRFIRVELSNVKEVLFAAFWAFWVGVVRSRIFQFLFLLVETFGGTYRVREGDGMNDLLTVCENNGHQVVNARNLHAGLGVGRDFATWIHERIAKYGFEEGRDYKAEQVLSSPDSGSSKARPQIMVEYYLSVPMAKELAMVENNEKGREVRQYLIKIEQAWNTPELVFARALQQANELITRQSSRIAELLPKAEFFDQVASSRSAISMREVAATLNIAGWGRNKIFQLLRDEKILDENNLPYRAYQDRGYFRVVENAWSAPDGERRINLTTLVYQRGLDYIRKTIKTKAAPAMAIAL